MNESYLIKAENGLKRASIYLEALPYGRKFDFNDLIGRRIANIDFDEENGVFNLVLENETRSKKASK